MIRRISIQVALLAFALAIVAGLSAGNRPETVLTRGLLALLVGFGVGQLGGLAAKLVLRDYLRSQKMRVDLEHLAEVEAKRRAMSEEEASATGTS